jgi:hypothetical protein
MTPSQADWPVPCVHEHDGEAELPGLRARTRAQHARRRLLAGAERLVAVVAMRLVQQLDEVAAVVDDDVRRDLERVSHVAAHLVRRRAVARVDMKAFGRERGHDVVLRRLGIAARDGHGCAAGPQHEREVGRFRLEVNADRDALAGERPLRGELRFELPQDRHVAPDPFDFALPFGRELRTGDDVLLHVEFRVQFAA